MSASLASLPPEILMQISSFVLAPPATIRIHISPPNERFGYSDSPSQIVSSRASKGSAVRERSAFPQQSEKPSLKPVRMLPNAPPARTRPRIPSTRSRTLAILPQRPHNPYQSRTAISLLLVNRQLHTIGTPFYYSSHTWDIGLHNRTPLIPTFRSFLDAIGPLARSCIRYVTVLSRFGYSCLWKSISSGWITQLRRCKGLKKIFILMTPEWVQTLEARGDTWSEDCTIVWQKRGLNAVTEVGVMPLEPQVSGERVIWVNTRELEGIGLTLDKALSKIREVKSLGDK